MNAHDTAAITAQLQQMSLSVTHDVATVLGQALAEKYGWTTRIMARKIYFSGRNAYDQITVTPETRKIELHWWFGSIRHCCLNIIIITVDDELNGELDILDRTTDVRTTTRYSNGLLPALRDAYIDV